MKRKTKISLAVLIWIFTAWPSLAQTVIEEHWSPYNYPKEVAADVQVHIVAKGDTLWDIAAKYFQDPLLWPQIYQVNPYIQDPDLIYPGDPILLKIGVVVEDQNVTEDGNGEGAGSDGQDLSELQEFSEGEGESGDSVSDRSQSTSLLGSGMEMTIIPAGDRADLECSSYIYPSSDPKEILPFDILVSGGESSIQESYAVDEVIYINKGEDDGIRAGDIYSLRRIVNTVYTPKTYAKKKNFIGFAIDQIGTAKVVAVQKTGATCIIMTACDPIMKDDFLVPYEQEPIPLITEQYPLDRFQPFNKEHAGIVIYSEDTVFNMGSGHIASINLGIEDDVAPGDIFILFRPNPHSDIKNNQILPDIYLGQAVALKTFNSTTVIKITKCSSEVQVGNFVVPYHQAIEGQNLQ